MVNIALGGINHIYHIGNNSMIAPGNPKQFTIINEYENVVG
jgi:hypothetical protein